MTRQEREARADQQRQDRDDRAALIARQVLHALGQPAGVYAVHVRRLWPGRYRVNVLRGEGPVSTTIAHSYFVLADADGLLLEASPAITRRY